METAKHGITGGIAAMPNGTCETPYSAARPEVKDYLASEMQTETASGGFTSRAYVNWS